MDTKETYGNKMITPEEIEAALKLCEAATNIPGWPGYKIDEQGRVFSEGTNWRGYGSRQLRAQPNSHGYLTVRLTRGDVRKRITIHHLVLKTFVSMKPSNLYEVRHLNGIRTDNRLANLRYGTRKENAEEK